MSFSVSALRPTEIDNDSSNDSDSELDPIFAEEILAGLQATPKTLSSKYFYDDVGSQLFQQITSHGDYYPTRKELEILQQIQRKLPNTFGDNAVEIIELGVGDGHKTQLLLDGFLASGREVHYTPIDISHKAMTLLEDNLPQNPALHVHGIVGEYLQALEQLDATADRSRLLLFLGSNIGNFDYQQSTAFLSNIRSRLQPGDHLLIGFDLKKDIGVLTRAYNDSDGITRAFNLNLLSRINRELDANFDVSKFDHVGIYNPTLGAMESYLISTESQCVSLGAMDAEISFRAYEPIHTEYSFKFLRDDIEELCAVSGFKVVEHFSDAQGYFIDSLWRA